MSINLNLYRGLELALDRLGIKSLFGPGWQKNVEDLCNILGEASESCAWLWRFAAEQKNFDDI